MNSLGAIPAHDIPSGNPLRLLRGVDYEGHLCGIDNVVSNLNYKYLPNLDLKTYSSRGYLAPALLGVCVSACPMEGDVVMDPYSYYGYWNASCDTRNLLGYCIPLYGSTGRIESFATEVFGDFVRTAGVIATFGFILTSFMSILFLCVIRIPCALRLLVWICIIGVFVGMGGGTV